MSWLTEEQRDRTVPRQGQSREWSKLTRTVLPAPCTPLSPRKNGGVLPSALACRSVWMRNRSSRKGMQCCDLSSTISGMLVVSSGLSVTVAGKFSVGGNLGFFRAPAGCVFAIPFVFLGRVVHSLGLVDYEGLTLPSIKRCTMSHCQ